MPLPRPQIIYDPGTGPVTLSFTFPPIQKPLLDDREAVRHDSITSSGLRQSALERIDIIKPLQMEYIPWEDWPNWQPFIDAALTGIDFAYYPDASLPDFQTFELVETSFNPKYSFRGISKFSMNFRLVAGGPSFP
jgi:hypothetical protein